MCHFTDLQPILQDLQKLINHTNELKFLSAQLRSKILRTKQVIFIDFFENLLLKNLFYRIWKSLSERVSTRFV